MLVDILTVRTAISVVLLCAALFVILSNKYPDAIVKWAVDTVGAILGHWLRLDWRLRSGRRVKSFKNELVPRPITEFTQTIRPFLCR